MPKFSPVHRPGCLLLLPLGFLLLPWAINLFLPKREDFSAIDNPAIAWQNYATLHRCPVAGHAYTRIELDLARFGYTREASPFYQPQLVVDAYWRHHRKPITKQMIDRASALPRTATIVITANNSTSPSSSTKADQVTTKVHQLMNSIRHLLPTRQFRFVVNELDEPRVLLDSLLPASDRLADRQLSSFNREYVLKILNSPQCATSREFDGTRVDWPRAAALHGIFIKPDSFGVTLDLLPVFSQSKINGCFDDITYPSPSYYDLLPVQEKDLVRWEDKSPVVFWRGTTTGGTNKMAEEYRRFHRHRLVQYARDHGNISVEQLGLNTTQHIPLDIRFTAVVQSATETVTQDIEREYGKVAHVAHRDHWRYKYLVSLDGNSYSGRFPTFLSSGSAVLRGGLFADWFEDRIQPFTHYVPFKLDLSDLESRIKWMAQHDDEVRRITERARVLAGEELGIESIRCFMARLLIEYENLVEVEGES